MENLLGKMQELLSDPESMKQISELAQMFKSGETDMQEETSSPPPEHSAPVTDFGIDPGMLLKAGELFRQQDNDKNTELLMALRPHLGQTRQLKVDKAVKLLRIWHIWKQMQESGMLRNLL